MGMTRIHRFVADTPGIVATLFFWDFIMESNTNCSDEREIAPSVCTPGTSVADSGYEAPIFDSPTVRVKIQPESGTISFEHAVAPTLALLDKGDQVWHPHLAVTLRKLVDAEVGATGTREQKLTAARASSALMAGWVAVRSALSWWPTPFGGPFNGRNHLARQAHERWRGLSRSSMCTTRWSSTLDPAICA